MRPIFLVGQESIEKNLLIESVYRSLLLLILLAEEVSEYAVLHRT